MCVCTLSFLHVHMHTHSHTRSHSLLPFPFCIYPFSTFEIWLLNQDFYQNSLPVWGPKSLRPGCKDPLSLAHWPQWVEGPNHWGQCAKLRGSLQGRYQPGREPKNDSKQDGAPTSPHHLGYRIMEPLGLHCCSFWYHLIVWEFFLFLILLFFWLEGFRQV